MTRQLLLAGAVLAPIATIGLAILGYGPVTALAPIFLSHILLLYPTLRPNCQWWGPVIRSFITDKREVWLTIDDGPSTDTLALLDLLDAHGARATFFLVGKNVEALPHVMTEIIARGHEVANHTFSHPSASFWCATPTRAIDEVSRCSALLRATPERPVRLFRAPAGLTNPFVHSIVARRELRIAGWSARAFDAVASQAKAAAERVLRSVVPGAIILLHEGKQPRIPGFHARCLELVLNRLTDDGYRFVIPTTDQLSTSVGGRQTDDC